MGQKSNSGTSGAGKGVNREAIVPAQQKAAAMLSKFADIVLGRPAESPEAAHDIGKALANNMRGLGITLEKQGQIIVDGADPVKLESLKGAELPGNLHDLFNEMKQEGYTIIGNLDPNEVAAANEHGNLYPAVDQTGFAKPKQIDNPVDFETYVRRFLDAGAAQKRATEEEAAQPDIDVTPDKDVPLDFNFQSYGDLRGIDKTLGQAMGSIDEIRTALGLGKAYIPKSRQAAMKRLFKGQPITQMLYYLFNTGEDAGQTSIGESFAHESVSNEELKATGMTRAEAGAVIRYTGAFYSQVNKLGRDGLKLLVRYLKEKDQGEKDKIIGDLKRLLNMEYGGKTKDTKAAVGLQLIMEAIAQGSMKENKTHVLARGDDRYWLSGGINEHDVMFDGGCWSTTDNDNQHNVYGAGEPIQYLMLTQKGMNVRRISDHGEENEVLVAPGLMWQVTAAMPDVPVYGGNNKEAYVLSEFDAETGEPVVKHLVDKEQKRKKAEKAKELGERVTLGEKAALEQKAAEEAREATRKRWNPETKQWEELTQEERENLEPKGTEIEPQLDTRVPYAWEAAWASEEMKKHARADWEKKGEKTRRKLAQAMPKQAQDVIFGEAGRAGFISGGEHGRIGALPVINVEENFTGEGVMMVTATKESKAQDIKMQYKTMTAARVELAAAAGVLYARLTETPAAYAVIKSPQGLSGIGTATLPGMKNIGDRHALEVRDKRAQQNFARRFLNGMVADIILGNTASANYVRVLQAQDGELFPVRDVESSTAVRGIVNDFGDALSLDERQVKADLGATYSSLLNDNSEYYELIQMSGYSKSELKAQLKEQYQRLKKFREHIGGFGNLATENNPSFEKMITIRMQALGALLEEEA